MPKGKCNSISLDTAAVIESIQNHLISALDQAEDKLIELMKQEIQKTVHGNGPGKPSWRNSVSNMLKETYRDVARGYIEVGVGLPHNVAENVFVRAMVIAEGAGSAVGGSPITAGPNGRSVWDDDLSEKKKSKAQSTWLLPEAFNQSGNHFVSNAVLLMEKHFKDVLDEAAASLPSSIFYMNVVVS